MIARLTLEKGRIRYKQNLSGKEEAEYYRTWAGDLYYAIQQKEHTLDSMLEDTRKMEIANAKWEAELGADEKIQALLSYVASAGHLSIARRDLLLAEACKLNSKEAYDQIMAISDTL